MIKIFVLFFSILMVIFWGLLTKKYTGRILRINILFSLLWIFVMYCSIFNNIGLVIPRDEIFINIFVAIFLFNIIYIIMYKNNNKDKISINYSKYNINNKKIIVLNIIAYILIIPFLIEAINIILTTGFNFGVIRDTIFVRISNSDNFFMQNSRVIINVVFSLTQLIATYYLVIFKYKKSKNEKKIIVLGILDVILSTIVFGGRGALFNFILFYLFNYLCNRNKKIKIKKRYIFLIIAILVFVTQNRTSNSIPFVQSFILYFAGSLSFLEVILRNPFYFGLDQKHYGAMTLGFIIEPIILFIKILGINIRIPSYYFNIYAQNFINIGENSIYQYNNNTTMFYPFALDFGLNGMFIGVIIYSLIISYVNRRKNSGNLRFYFIYILLCAGVMNSSMDYDLIGYSKFILFLTILFVVKKKKKEQLDGNEES